MKIIQLYNNETSLIKRAVKNNREAQHTLFEIHAPKMLSVCRYYISDIQYAEEAMLNGFYKVFTKLNNYNFQGSFEGWIRKIMVRESISFIRSLKRIEFPTEEIEINEYSNNINTEIGIAEIQYLIDSLPEGYRMIFVMYAIEGYKHTEIAKELNISVGTSKSQLFKARRTLQQKINKLKNRSNVTN